MNARSICYPIITVHTTNPDPSQAINAFLWCMAKARDLGMSPPTEHVLAEALFRKDAKIMFYSSMNGVTSLVMDDVATADFDEDDFDFMVSLLRRRKERAKERALEAEAAARGIEARSVATAGRDPQDESPVRKDAPEHRQEGSTDEG